MRQNVVDYQWDRLKPLLQQIGFTGPQKRTYRKGHPELTWCYELDWAWDEWNVTRMRNITLYANDSYPCTSKEEAILHVWNDFGSDSQKYCQEIADRLTQLGIRARATRYKKYHVIAFDPGDWLNTPELKDEVGVIAS